MMIRQANKILLRALNYGELPRDSPLQRAIAASPRYMRRRNHKAYLAAGITAAFLKLGMTIHELRFNLEGDTAMHAIESLGE